MKLAVLSSLLALFLSIGATQDTSLATVKAAFDAANIPNDIHITFNPTVLLEVTFPEAAGPPVAVTAGVQLPRNGKTYACGKGFVISPCSYTATVGPPTFAVRGNIRRGQTFLVATVDPDAPTPQDPTVAQIRHLLAPNFVLVDGNSRHHTKALVNETAPISPWQQPTPPAGSDAHR
ncbi:hypothetical protein PHLCEN_2v1118 [Hermanssonia centrifuga]|uniref:Uncharacterized protein n=1 Tax=Hermanssonia centrifuga TaxID=98765 RepID=A0A2R6S4D8_9APHY|nr:hypothetical protein PHLCEN_2v1118 [Hermanssonia centrifuga]